MVCHVRTWGKTGWFDDLSADFPLQLVTVCFDCGHVNCYLPFEDCARLARALKRSEKEEPEAEE